jgi:hypothetical protein
MKIVFTVLLAASFYPLVQAQNLANYQAVVTGQSPFAYFKLDGSLVDSITPSQSLTASGGYFSTDAGRHLTNCYAFLLQADALTLANDIIPGGDPVGTNSAANGVGSISVLFRSLDGSPTGQRFIFSQGAGNTTNGNALSLFFENGTSTGTGPGDLKLRVGNTTVSILASNLVAPGMWYHFAMTYDETRDAGEINWYLGRAGDVESSGVMDIGNDAVVGDNGTVALGNQVAQSSGYRTPGEGRVDEFAVWNRALNSSEVAAEFAALPNFLPTNVTYQQLVTAQRPSHFYELNNSLADSAGGPSLTINGPGGYFTNDILGASTSAFAFNATNDALIVASDLINGGGSGPNTAANGIGAISVLFRYLDTPTNNGQRYIFAQGTGTSTLKNQLSLFLENTNILNGDPNSLKLRLGNGPTTTIIQSANLIPDAWYYFAFAYDEARDSTAGGEVHYYVGPVGGILSTGAINIANDAVIGDNGTIYIGNNATLVNGFRSPGTGVIDELAIFNDELSAAEITAQFLAVTNVVASGPAPTLSVSLSGSDAVLSWPAATPASFALEATGDLLNGPWTNAGTPTTVGTNFTVTSPTVFPYQFFRLHKP